MMSLFSTSTSDRGPGEVRIRLERFAIRFGGETKLRFEADEHDRPIRVNQGETVLVVGQSGEGKTIFLKLLAGLLSDNQADLKGKIKLGRAEPASVKSYRRYKKLVKEYFGQYAAMVHQDAINSLHPYRSLWRQLHECDRMAASSPGGMGRLFSRGGPESMDRIVSILGNGAINNGNGVDLLRHLNPGLVRVSNGEVVEDLKRKKSTGLSGGMCQRLGVGKVLVQEPALLFMDEPLSDLDVSSRKNLRELLFRLLGFDGQPTPERSATVFMASHSPDIIEKCDRFDHVFYVENNVLHPGGLEKLPSQWRRPLGYRELTSRTAPDAPVVLRTGAPVCYRYPGAKKNAVDMEPQHRVFNLGQGEMVGLVGESGSGKTTLAMILSHFIRDARVGLSYGAGRKPDGWRNTLYNDLQVVFQDSAGSVDLNEPIGRVVGRIISKLEKKDEHVDAGALFGEIDLDYDNIRERRPHQLSMGMLRRYSLVKAYMNLLPIRPGDSKILILDEITRGLDPINKKRVYDFLVNRIGAPETACIVVSHDLEFVKNLCERILIMFGGWLVEERRGSRGEKFHGPWRHPYSKKLWAGDEIIPIPGRNGAGDPLACKFLPYCDLPKKGEEHRCVLGNMSFNKYTDQDDRGKFFCLKEGERNARK